MSPPRPELTVEFSVEDGLQATWDGPRIAPLVRSIVLRERSPEGRYVLGVHLVSEETIRAMNATHRGQDAPTDVLSFPLDDDSFVVPPGEPAHLGDVVVSYSRAADQAREYGHSLEREIAYLVAHGVLHLLGYEHEQPAERRRMRRKEEDALAPLGFTR